jgi:hypothetical protein
VPGQRMVVASLTELTLATLREFAG